VAELATDFLNPERKARLLAIWESYVRDEPEYAYQQGPPNWLVREDWKGQKKESFLTAAERVKARYFPFGLEGALSIKRGVEDARAGRIVTVWPESLQGIVTLPDESLQDEEGIVTPAGESLQRVCEECGGSMEGRGAKATVCSGACRVKKMRRERRGA